VKRVICGAAWLAACITLLCGCANQPAEADYRRYLDHMPASVVVLPPLNESTRVESPDLFLSTITRPLAERGYYVFPVAVVHQMLKENGLPTPGEMHQVPPAKFREILGADAVLYITIKEWTTRYVVIDSSTSVGLEFRLVDSGSGEELWSQARTVVYHSSDGTGGGGEPISVLLAMTIAAAVDATAKTDTRQQLPVAVQANNLLVNDPNQGMLVGARHSGFKADQQQRRAALAAATPAPASP
jgi:hypothetical protein